MAARLLRETSFMAVFPPSARNFRQPPILRNVARAGDGVLLADEALHLPPVGERYRAYAERRRDAGDEGAELAGRQGPQLDFDRRAVAVAGAHQPRLARVRSRQLVETVGRRGKRGADEARAARGQLVVERQPGKVRAYHGEHDTVGRAADAGRARSRKRMAVAPSCAPVRRAGCGPHIRAARPSPNAGATSVTPAGSPSRRRPAGTATAQ